MKIFITGANGFLGKYLNSFFKKEYEVYAFSKLELNTCNKIHVKQLLETIKPNIILHCAAQGRYDPLSHDTTILNNNLNSFLNLVEYQEYYDILINIGTGAEFGLEKNLMNVKEHEVFNSFPNHTYGLSKNIITRLIHTLNNKFCNLRIFGCFDKTEDQNRLFKKILYTLNDNNVFTLQEDRFFDFISVNDIAIVIENIIKFGIEFKDINCVYENKMLLSDILKLFVKANNLDINLLKIENKKINNYTGNAERIKKYSNQFQGLERGFECYSQI